MAEIVKYTDLPEWGKTVIIRALPRDEQGNIIHDAIKEGYIETPDGEKMMTVAMQINGVEVNPFQVFEAYRRDWWFQVEKAAAELVKDELHEIHNTTEMLQEYLDEAARVMRQKLEEKGITWRDYD